MTETQGFTQVPPVPPTVPNVSHGAISGIDHHVIGAAAQEVHAAQYGDQTATATDSDPVDALEYVLLSIPDDLTSVPDLLGWVADGEVDDEDGSTYDRADGSSYDRAVAVLVQERTRDLTDRRKTLVEPLERILIDAVLETAEAYVQVPDEAPETPEEPVTPDSSPETVPDPTPDSTPDPGPVSDVPGDTTGTGIPDAIE